MKFSVITICWNNLAGLKKTHASVKKQSNRDYEWIVIDGASTDGTPDYLKAINEPGFRYVSEPDKGLYDAMNKGIEMAQGNYMVFMNSGDMFLDENTLQLVSSEMDKYDDIALIYGDALDYEPDGKTHYRKARSHKTIARGMFTQHQAMFFKRFEKEKQPKYNLEYKYSADYQFIIKYLNLEQKGYKIIQIEKPLCQYELGGLNETQRTRGMKDDYQIRKNDLTLGFFRNNTLYLAHYFHKFLKSSFPELMRGLRYRN